MIFAGKKVLVFGTGKSGIAAEDLLHKKGASVVLYDGNDKLEKEEILKKLESRDSVEVVLGELPEEMLDSLDLVVLSPGVPTDLPVVLKMKEKEIPVIGEVELAYQVSRGKVLAITGTNGKTTTTSLLGEIMKTYQPEVKVVGNIGTPYTSAALDTTDDTVTVAEISSFQLETIKEFHPAASAITNITEDHLNRHHTMEEYIRVKECITENQTMDDLCVLNYEDEILRPFGEKLMAEKKVQVMYFSSLRALKDGIYYQDGEIRIAKNGETELLNVALREVREESGVQNVQPVTPEIYSLEVLPVTQHIKRGKFVSAHLHLNLTYLLQADEHEMLRCKPDENSGVRWFTPEEALGASSEPWFVERIYKKLNARLADYTKEATNARSS